MSDKELGLLLVNANYITQQDILTSLQGYFIEIVNRLFTWVEGFFRFENDLLPPDDKITVRVEPGKHHHRRLAPAARVGAAPG